MNEHECSKNGKEKAGKHTHWGRQAPVCIFGGYELTRCTHDGATKMAQCLSVCYSSWGLRFSSIIHSSWLTAAINPSSKGPRLFPGLRRYQQTWFVQACICAHIPLKMHIWEICLKRKAELKC